MTLIRTLYRALFLLFIVAGAMRSSAQTAMRSDVAVWAVGSSMEDTTLSDIEGESADIFFDEQPGLGISFNRYWTASFSTELALTTFGADMSAETPLGEFELGELDGRAVTAMAQWHFARDTRVSPYFGAGIAHVGGTFDPVDDEEEDLGTIDLESEITWTAVAGLDVNLTDRIALSFEAKHVAWSAVDEGGADEDAIDINPTLYGAGVRFRF